MWANEGALDLPCVLTSTHINYFCADDETPYILQEQRSWTSAIFCEAKEDHSWAAGGRIG